MSKLKSARELILKVLFQIEVGKLPPDEALETSFEQVRPSPEDRAYVDEVVRGVVAETEELDAIIGSLAEGWRLDRLAKVDKNVLRTALYELRHQPAAPVSVVVNDAVDVAKKYSTEDSGRFVNGILGSFLRGRNPDGAVEDAGEDEIEVGAL
ncbi:MAG TPA: transcription antitermination factor NusB [Armatimonadota bacterium]|nr:transcription antitermination factor NusB [Armatimonadota bacterium]